MTGDKLEGLLETKDFECKGIDQDGFTYWERGRTNFNEIPQVIVKIYKNGKTIPLCKHYCPQFAKPRCNPEMNKEAKEDDLGVCPYASEK